MHMTRIVYVQVDSCRCRPGHAHRGGQCVSDVGAAAAAAPSPASASRQASAGAGIQKQVSRIWCHVICTDDDMVSCSMYG